MHARSPRAARRLLIAALCAALAAPSASCAPQRAADSPPPVSAATPSSATLLPAPAAGATASTDASPATAASPSPSPNAAAVAASAPAARTPAKLPASLDTRAILADTRRITALGVRRGGSRAEWRAADFVIARLKSLGYKPLVQEFDLPGGQTSRNVIVVIPGSDPRRIVLSAHTDSRVPSPGANDDAVGVAALLALAKQARGVKPVPTIELDFFGSEEYRDSTPGAHHFGSRARVASLSAAQLRRIAGMVSIDVIAVGSHLHTRTMGRGPLTMSNLLRRTARKQGVTMTYLRDLGSTGWSDHEPYENAGVPAVWVERLTDPAYHTTGDTADHLEAASVAETMRVVLGALNSLDARGLDRLR